MDEFERLDPSARVLFGAHSATITGTLGATERGDVLVIPVTNADSLTVTNGSGFNQAIAIPTMTRNRIPRTIVSDLSLLEPDDITRTSNVWHFALTCSTTNLVVGAAIALYSPRTDFLAGDFQWGGSEIRSAYGTSHENEYGTRYLLTDETLRRSLSLSKLATQADLDAMFAWFGTSWGAYGPSFIWPDPAVNDGYLGTLQQTIDVKRVAPTTEGPLFQVTIQFDELSKGRPV